MGVTKMAVTTIPTLDPQWLTAARFADEPQWLTEQRQAAWTQLAELPLPRFTKVAYGDWPLTAFTNELAKPAAPIDDATDDYQLVSVGQTTQILTLPDALQQQGVILCDWPTALREHEALVRRYLFQKAVRPNEDRLTALNAALMNAGAFLYIPENAVLQTPINLWQLQDSRQATNFVSHTVIVAAPHSDFQVLQHLSTVGEIANPAHVTVEVVAEAGSHVRFSSLDAFGKTTHAYVNRRGHLERDAEIDWTMGVFNEGNVIADFNSNLREPGSHTEVQTVAVSTHDQQQGINTKVTNYGRHSEGNILQRGVVLQDSTLVFNGIGKIIHGAHGAKAQQENRLLMLSPTASGDANPILLINENDVIAGHAASVGRINEKQLYYLMSRGLPEAVAKRLVIRGFLGVILSAIPVVSVRQRMVDLIDQKLNLAEAGDQRD